VHTTPASSERIAHLPASGEVSESLEIVEKEALPLLPRIRKCRLDVPVDGSGATHP
jgi:hypothetical protein